MVRIFLLLFIKLLYLTENVHANTNEVLGCGGFIKSHANIDFSRVELKLLTKQGALKDKTDCSPSNGYYFLPIYDKGEYVLRIAPPPGWSFEPEEVQLNFDGKTDICSQGKDLNFVFKGFGITGKVTLADAKSTGANGIDVELRSSDGSATRHTKTDINGIFSFSPVIPGKYIVKANHPTWHFAKAEHEVVVKSGNTELPRNSLVVAGFDVSGNFDMTEQSMTGLGMALFKSKDHNLPLKCDKGNEVSLTADNAKYEVHSACYAKIDHSGAYSFAGVAPGRYLIQPVVENSKLKLNIEPAFMEFEVTKDVLQIKNTFKIAGFDVKGRVLNAQAGTPIANAVVKLNGEKLPQTTDAEGTYILKNIKSATYKIQVEVPRHEFNELSVDLKLTSVTIPDIVPNAYEVCGKVLSKKSYVVEFTKQGSTFHTSTKTRPETGGWCINLPSGRYVIQVRVSEVDRSTGVQFYPVQQNIEVTTLPMSDILFSQLRATLDGEVKCLDDTPAACKATEVTLHSLDATGQTTGLKQKTLSQGGKYVFRDILPGPYELTIPQNGLCFESTRIFINIATSKETAPLFVQRGYEVSIISSHRAIMKYTFKAPAAQETPTARTSTETIKILAGVNTFCVAKYGVYNFKLEGCHLYEDNAPESFTTNIDSSANNAIIISAIAHKVGVRVLSTESNAATLDLMVESPSLGKQTVKPVAENYKVDGKYVYYYDTHLKPGEVLHVTPISETLLFSPQTTDIVGPTDCVDIAFSFSAKRGLTLNGKVVPAIKDAKITLSFPNNADLVPLTAFTNEAGEFKFGPVDEDLHYEVTAEKESYVFAPYNRETSSFSAHKLCEIVVKVKTQEADKPLSGVLLSLSGGESYRKNLITGDNGAMSFHSLSPSQYFLRPIMKEYKFEPNSQMIEITDGQTVEVDLVAKRVAYSVFGSITSLNGEPFPQVNLLATADEVCQYHEEETTSEPNGQYRLRGLQPGCTYTIRSKISLEPGASYVERTVPAQHRVSVEHADIHKINMVAISPISVLDVTIRVTAALNDYYKTLRLVMYRKDSPDLHIYSQRVDTPHNPKARYNPGIMVFPPRVPLDGKTYVVELRSTLSDKTYAFTQPMAVFVANTSSIFLELDFKPEVRVTEGDVSQNSISALILVALVVIAFFKQDIAMDCLNFVWSRVNGVLQDFADRQKTQQNNARRTVEPLNKREIEQMAEQINAIKKKKTKKI